VTLASFIIRKPARPSYRSLCGRAVFVKPPPSRRSEQQSDPTIIFRSGRRQGNAGDRGGGVRPINSTPRNHDTRGLSLDNKRDHFPLRYFLRFASVCPNRLTLSSEAAANPARTRDLSRGRTFTGGHPLPKPYDHTNTSSNLRTMESRSKRHRRAAVTRRGRGRRSACLQQSDATIKSRGTPSLKKPALRSAVRFTQIQQPPSRAVVSAIPDVMAVFSA